MTTTINCEYQNPINLGTLEMPDFEFQNQVCSSTNNYFQEYQVEINGTTTPFIFSNVWSGPAITLITFAFVMMIFVIFISIFSFVARKKISIQRKQ
jgi:hypothetical protein